MPSVQVGTCCCRAAMRFGSCKDSCRGRTFGEVHAHVAIAHLDVADSASAAHARARAIAARRGAKVLPGVARSPASVGLAAVSIEVLIEDEAPAFGCCRRRGRQGQHRKEACGEAQAQGRLHALLP